MKPAWDQLGSEYASSSSVVIADVDCTVEQDVCSQYDVKGYPTIKYFTAESPETGSDYNGGRDFEGLKSFVSETLEVKCLLADTSGCNEKEVEFMNKWKAKPAADVASQAERLDKMMTSKMTPDLKKWLVQRISILKQLKEA
jgi:protein disulfide-isomerase A6